jgi:hypothetical protein
MVNGCEHLINAVTRDKLKMQSKRLEPKGEAGEIRTAIFLVMASGRNGRCQDSDEPNLPSGSLKRGKPDVSPGNGQGSRKATCRGSGHGKVEKAKACL